jgi:hypothetical protein
MEGSPLKMRLAGLHLETEKGSSRALRGSVADKQVFCEGVFPFEPAIEVAASRPTEFSTDAILLIQKF